MLRSYIILFGWLMGCGISLGQTASPLLLWQRSWGSVSNDFLFSIQVTDGGGLVLGGVSDSEAGDNKTASKIGGNDFWVIRLNASGGMVWDKTFGGTNDDFLITTKATPDGGLVLGGTSLSGASGNKGSTNFGSQDYWIVRLDSGGNKLWDRTFGGKSGDYFQDLTVLPDGGFLLAGYSFSVADGNKSSAPYGFMDYWAIRLDSTGNKIWDRSFGGADNDYLTQVELNTNGQYVLAGYSSSEISGNRSSPNLGGSDYWILIVDTNGTKVSEQALGGNSDEVLLSMERVADGGFVLGGSSSSGISGNKESGNFGEDDFWIVRLDGEANRLWDRSYGGTGRDVLRGMVEMNDHDLVLGGWSDSGPSGSKTSWLHGRSDFWVVHVDSTGEVNWDQAYGGSNHDVILSVALLNDTNVLVGGYSFSPVSGCKTTAPLGLADYWLLNLSDQDDLPLDVLRLLAPPQSRELVQLEGFRLRLEGQSNCCYIVEYSTDLNTWTPFVTNFLQGAQTEILDESARDGQHRFYRALLWP